MKGDSMIDPRLVAEWVLGVVDWQREVAGLGRCETQPPEGAGSDVSDGSDGS